MELIIDGITSGPLESWVAVKELNLTYQILWTIHSKGNMVSGLW